MQRLRDPDLDYRDAGQRSLDALWIPRIESRYLNWLHFGEATGQPLLVVAIECAAGIAGLIVVQDAGGKLVHYNALGYVVVGTMLATVIMMYFINQMTLQFSRNTI